MSEKYLKRGVSAKKEEVHQAISNLNQGLYSNLFCKVFPDILSGDSEYLNLMSSDGSGTKSILAYMYWKETGDASVFRGIGQDALVMNLDDMMCVGADQNFLFTSIINRNKNRIPGEIIQEIIEGTKEYIDKLNTYGLNIVYTGGETADVGDVVRTVSVDASMAARMPIKNLIQTGSIAPGNIIIGVASYGDCLYEKEYNSGMGSNGLTSARHDILHKSYSDKYPETIEPLVDSEVQYCGKYKMTDIVFDQKILGKMLLSPTMSYAPILKTLFDSEFRSAIKSIVHCTGGAATKVLHFAEKVKIVKNDIIPIPPLFDMIQKESQTDWKEMFQVFNMGTRLELYLENENNSSEIIDIVKSFGLNAKVIGYVEKSEIAEVEVHFNKQVYKYNK